MKKWLIGGAFAIVFVLASSIPSQATSEPTWSWFWWAGGDGPITMVSSTNNFCFLQEFSVGNSSTDSVSIYINNNTWMLSGTSTAGGYTYALAGCVAWPVTFTTNFYPWANAPGKNLSSNNCFCTIEGVSYSGSTDQNTEDWQVQGYPDANMSVQLTENVQNFADNVNPAAAVQSACLCQSGQSPYWGTVELDPPGYRLTNATGNFTPVTSYNTTWTVVSSVPQVCGLLSVTSSQSGGPFSVGIELSNDGINPHDWFVTEGGANSAQAGCIAYP
jgi:hypothetical protein